MASIVGEPRSRAGASVPTRPAGLAREPIALRVNLKYHAALTRGAVDEHRAAQDAGGHGVRVAQVREADDQDVLKPPSRLKGGGSRWIPFGRPPTSTLDAVGGHDPQLRRVR